MVFLFSQQSVLPSLAELAAARLVPRCAQQPAVVVLPPPLLIRSPRLFRPLHFLLHLPFMELLVTPEDKDLQELLEVKDPQGLRELQDPPDLQDLPDPLHLLVLRLHAVLSPLRENKQDEKALSIPRLIFSQFNSSIVSS